MTRHRLSEADVTALNDRAFWKVPLRHRTQQGQRAARTIRAPSETDECRTFIAWTQLVTFQGEPLSQRVVHIPNERGKAGAAVAILTAIGLRRGFPDYAILAPAGRWHGLYLEAKRRRGSLTGADQTAWRIRLNQWGYCSEICDGAIELILATRRYFFLSGATAAGIFIDNTRLHGT